MTDRPTLGQQLDEREKRNRQRERRPAQPPLQATLTTLNAVLSIWLMISVVGLIAAGLGLVLLFRIVF